MPAARSDTAKQGWEDIPSARSPGRTHIRSGPSPPLSPLFEENFQSAFVLGLLNALSICFYSIWACFTLEKQGRIGYCEDQIFQFCMRMCISQHFSPSIARPASDSMPAVRAGRHHRKYPQASHRLLLRRHQGRRGRRGQPLRASVVQVGQGAFLESFRCVPVARNRALGIAGDRLVYSLHPFGRGEPCRAGEPQA